MSMGTSETLAPVSVGGLLQINHLLQFTNLSNSPDNIRIVFLQNDS